MSSEEELKQALETYQQQLSQIELMLNLNPNETEILNLKSDLEDIINLTKESLLEVKRKNLLAELDKLVGSNTESAPTTSKAAIDSDNKKSDDTNTSNESNDNDDNNEIDLSGIIGSKCRIPFNCSVTNLKMHNAMVLGVSSLEKNTVDVLFCNPTQQFMKACEFYLEGNCKFGADCKFSHGYEIDVDKLELYKEADLKKIKIGKLCLAKYNDGLWHLATIESIDDNDICVQFKQFNKVEALPWESVLVIDENEASCVKSVEQYNDLDINDDSSDEEDDDDDDIISKVAFEPRSLNSSGFGLGNLGTWEKYTRGIGSKLLSKMGYVPGKGLGSKGEGRVEPIDVYVLPAGKSLDKIMELKEKKKLKKEKFMPKIEKNDKAEPDVFEFINKTLSKEPVSDKSKKVKNVDDISGKSSKNLKIEMLKTHEEIQNIEKNIVKLKQSLERNKNSDAGTVNHIKQKLLQNEQKLASLKKAETKIQNEQLKRKDKSEIF